MASVARLVPDHSSSFSQINTPQDGNHELVARTAVHELREPVQAILSFLGVLLEERAGPLSELQRDFIATADQATRRLNRRIDDLHLIIMSSPDVTIRPEPTDLLGRVATCCHELSLIAASYGVQIDLSTQRLTQRPCIWADPDRIDQILLNVIENAIQYSMRGTTVRVTVSPEGDDKWNVTIENTTSVEIKEDPATWFEPQRRGDYGAENRKCGLGIGLSAAEKLTRAQGGTISASLRRRKVLVSVTFPSLPESLQD